MARRTEAERERPEDRHWRAMAPRLDSALAKHLVLCRLHEDMKSREVDDATGIGVGKLDAPVMGVEDLRFSCHVGSLSKVAKVKGLEWR